MIVYVFVISLLLPSFGGQVKIEIKTTTEKACWEIRRAAVLQLKDAGIDKYSVSACEERNDIMR